MANALTKPSSVTLSMFGNRRIIRTWLHPGRLMSQNSPVRPNGQQCPLFHRISHLQPERQEQHTRITPLHVSSILFSLPSTTRLRVRRMQDPQDRGPGYRNVVGIPGGYDSELFKVFESKNKNGMKLIPGEGAEFRNGRATENDAINTVYIVDSNALPFHQAEMCVSRPRP